MKKQDYNPPINSNVRKAMHEVWQANVKDMQRIIRTQGNPFSKLMKSKQTA